MCLIGPLWAFGELADEVREGQPFEFDEPFLLGARALASDEADWWMVLASDVGYLGGLIPLNITLLIVLLAFKQIRKAVFFGLAVGGSALINLGVKLLFRRDRPTLWESIAPEHSFSFPSGHAMGSMTLAAAAIMLTWHTKWRWPVLLAGLAFAFWVATARVYLGVHYPSDILAGWVAAWAWCAIVYLSVRPHRHTAQLPDADPGSAKAKAAPEEKVPAPDAAPTVLDPHHGEPPVPPTPGAAPPREATPEGQAEEAEAAAKKAAAESPPPGDAPPGAKPPG